MLQRISGLLVVCLCAVWASAQAISSGDLEKLSSRPNYNGAPVYGWLTIAPLGEKFTVDMPGPAQTVLFTNGPAAVPRGYGYADMSAKAFYTVISGARPTVQDAKTKRKRPRTDQELLGELNKFLAEAASAASSNNAAPATNSFFYDGKLTEKGQSFYQYRFSDANGLGYMRLYLLPEMFYFVLAVSPNFNETNNFLSSFTLGAVNRDEAKSNVRVVKVELEKPAKDTGKTSP